MGLYAQDTHVSIIVSKGEIERMIRKYGAGQLYSMEDAENGRMLIGFTAHGRMVRFEIIVPKPEEFAVSPAGRARLEGVRIQLAEKELRRRWRALLLVIKAKLEAVSSAIAIFEQEFFGYIVMPGGDSLYHLAKDSVSKSLATERPPVFNLPGPELKGK
jgi:hypothetical protein